MLALAGTAVLVAEGLGVRLGVAARAGSAVAIAVAVGDGRGACARLDGASLTRRTAVRRGITATSGIAVYVGSTTAAAETVGTGVAGCTVKAVAVAFARAIIADAVAGASNRA